MGVQLSSLVGRKALFPTYAKYFVDAILNESSAEHTASSASGAVVTCRHIITL